MERGPMALFGALVAVGLGPALWLGAQIGNVGGVPPRAPVVQSEVQPAPTRETPGGVGAAEDDDDPVEVAPQPKRKSNYLPATEAPKPKPSKTTTAPPRDDKTDEPAPGPTETGGTDVPPTESTTSPSQDTEEPGGGAEDPGAEVPPAPGDQDGDPEATV